MRYDENKIAKILNSIHKDQLILSGRSWSKWIDLFLGYINLIDENEYDNIESSEKKYRQFQKSDLLVAFLY